MVENAKSKPSTFVGRMAPEVVLEVEADRCKEEVVLDIVDCGSSLSQFDGKALIALKNISSASSDGIS
jgi:hypothetical protein